MLFIAKVRVTRVAEIVVYAKDEAHARELLANPEPEWDWREADAIENADVAESSVDELRPATVEAIAELRVDPDFTPYGHSDAFAETVAECMAHDLEEWPGLEADDGKVDAWADRWETRRDEFRDRINELQAR